MSILIASERLMAMDDAIWRRHANPWSVWTRVITPLPLFALAVWSRTWLGWGALLPIAMVLGWIWWNPRAFGAPQSFDSWAARGVLGERVYLHHRSDIAPHHSAPTKVLLWISGLGILPYGFGLWRLELWPVLLGIALIVLGKMWFVDRMAWIWDDWHRSGRGIADL